MNLFQKQQNTIRYNSIPNAIADDETAAVPLGTTLLPPSKTTMGHRLSKRIAIVAGVMMLLTMAGGTVWMMPYGGIMTAAAWHPPRCASDYGKNTPCCGQGGGVVAPERQCPENMPFCANYIYGDHWGYCG